MVQRYTWAKARGSLPCGVALDKDMAKIKTAQINPWVKEPQQAVKGSREVRALVTFTQPALW